MRLTENPFKILEVIPSDNLNTINQQAEDKAFMDDENERIYEDARTTLLSPIKRVAAEIGWVYDKNINQVLSEIQRNSITNNLYGYDALEKVCILTECLYVCQSSQLSDIIIDLDRFYTEVSDTGYLSIILNKINTARETANIPPCNDIGLLQSEIKQKLSEINSAINYLFDDFRDDDLIKGSVTTNG